MIILFLVGYASIAMEHTLKVNKAATALLLCALLWTVYILKADSVLTQFSSHEEVVSFVTGNQIIEHLGDVASTLFFLMGAMTIVELIDAHGGFSIITNKITTRKKKKLLWMLAVITFFMSAILDNLTTTIVMVMLLRKLITNYKERWLFACVIVIAANSGGAFSPIGDVTTIMLWVKGNVTTEGLLPNLILPSIISMVLPVFIAGRFLKGELPERTEVVSTSGFDHVCAADIITHKEQKLIFLMGVGALIFVPIFKSITHLPPFIGVLLGLGVLWIYTEILYHRKKHIPESSKARISVVLSRVDFTTILFFLGILMAVSALQCAGILKELSLFLDQHVGNVYVIDMIIGALSSIVDNVPLVAGSMGMYDVASAANVAANPDLAVYATDGVFWLFLAYCAGVGGSMLIIGSAAGVVVMGLEKVPFGWYLKNISLLALIGYLAGALFFVLQEEVIRPLL